MRINGFGQDMAIVLYLIDLETIFSFTPPARGSRGDG
jgi:hypothetical protein